MQLAVCAETMFTDRPLAERFAAIRATGIGTVELWGLAPEQVEPVGAALAATGCGLALFCGNRAHSLIDPGERQWFLRELQQSMVHARRLGCTRLTVLSDKVDGQGIPIPPALPLTPEERIRSMLDGLDAAASAAEEQGVLLLLEPLNTKVDHPGYTLAHSAQAFEIVRTIGSPHVRVLYDVYHMQIMEGDLIRTMAENLEYIGHIHVADVPGRHEPGTGEINYRNIAAMLRARGYAGSIGLECVPKGDAAAAIAAFVDAFASRNGCTVSDAVGLDRPRPGDARYDESLGET